MQGAGHAKTDSVLSSADMFSHLSRSRTDDNSKDGIRKMDRQNIKSYIIALLGFAAALIADQLTKYLAVLNLQNKSAKVIIDGVFELRYLENRGAAFGMMQNMQYFFVAGAVVVCAVVVVLYIRMPHTARYMPLRVCAVLLCAGAAGNMIDRIRLNYVIDFFYFRLIDFPIFNVADCYVVISCVLFALLILFYYREDDDFKFLDRKKG